MNTLSSLLKFIANSIADIITDQDAKKVLAAPNGAAGKPSFRELQASDITSGELATDRIPSLDASKIASGTLASGRLPTVPISKGGSGQIGITTPSISISTTTGTLDSYNVRQWGKVVQLTLYVKKQSYDTPAGGDIYEGTINTASLRPTISTRGNGYYGHIPIAGAISYEGVIQVRNISSSTALNKNTVVAVNFIYLIP